MPDILDEFEKRIAANKRELEEQEHALEVLRRAMGKQGATNTPSSPVILAADAESETKFDDLFSTPNLAKRHQLVDDVKDVISKFGEKEFTVAIVEKALAQTGVVIDAKQPRARISLAMGKLIEEGRVDLTSKGAGNQPNIYKLKHEDESK